MAWIYILRGSSGRHYIGSTENLARRLEEHRRGSNYTTHRLGGQLNLVLTKMVTDMTEARQIERMLKRKKNPRLAIETLEKMLQSSPESRKLSGLVVGSSPTQPR